MVALALPLVAISAGLQSCNEDGPGIPSEDAIEETTQVKNLLMRSPEEAIDIAQRAWEDFYGDGASPASRSGRCVIDYGRPVEVVRSAKSRGSSASDTLLYVVNFADDGGFAVIAAPRNIDELLAVTSQGHYYPESQPDQEAVPGFELWMENARAYAASGPVSMDTTKRYPPLVGLDTLGPGGKPVFPPGGPTIERDTTGKPDSIDPGNPGRLQQKEWEDTIIHSIVNPQIKNSWGQGNKKIKDLYKYPEGYLFSNGLCGCGTLAVAQACLFFKEPSQVYINGSYQDLDWSKMCLHKIWRSQTAETSPIDNCPGTNREPAHSMIAWLCRVIGDKAKATPHNEGTGTKRGNLLNAIKEILPNRAVSNNWISFYNTNVQVGSGRIMIVTADNKFGPGHVWVCDGSRHTEYYHYYATRDNSSKPWIIQNKTHIVQKYNHFNWGWNGLDNGWFDQAVISFTGSDENMEFHDFQYVMVY